MLHLKRAIIISELYYFNPVVFESTGTDLVTVFDAILMSSQTCEKLQCLYDNLM